MDDNTLLLRQVNPSWIQANVVTSQAFKPTPKDNLKLSAYNNDKFTAEDAHAHYIGSGLKSQGVIAVACNECAEINLSAIEDNNPFDGHSVIDFDKTPALSNKDVVTKSQYLKSVAMTRGWLFVSK